MDNSQKRLRPALESGQVIIADRYSDSWFAYQSVRLAEYFGDEENSLDYLVSIHKSLVDRRILLEPDRTILLRADPKTAMMRIDKRATGATKSKYEASEFQIRVAAQYSIIAQRFSDRIVVIDTESKDLDQVCNDVIHVLGFCQN